MHNNIKVLQPKSYFDLHIFESLKKIYGPVVSEITCLIKVDTDDRQTDRRKRETSFFGTVGVINVEKTEKCLFVRWTRLPTTLPLLNIQEVKNIAAV